MTDLTTLSLSTRRRSASDDNLIPLINIVFLLLIFFMVASQIDAFRPADVTLPEAAATEKVDVQSLTIAVDADGTIFVEEQAVDVEQLRLWVDTLDLSLPDTQIAVQADKYVTAAALSPVLAVLREYQLASITLYVQRSTLEAS